jgi:putative transposase
MTKNTVIDSARPSDFSPDPLTDLLRAGAQELLAAAVRAEVSEFMAGHPSLGAS